MKDALKEQTVGGSDALRDEEQRDYYADLS
jgi:hypothetical protein